VDHHIGSILDVLRQEGLEDNTLVVYSSDHGDFVGGHGLIEKAAWAQCYYEEVLRVPMIFRWPGKIPAAAIRHDLVQLADMYPTLLDLCGLPSPQGQWLDGQSLAATIHGQKKLNRSFVVSENWLQATVVTGDFKYGQWVDCPDPKSDSRSFGNMLMQRSKDTGEVRNLIAENSTAEKLKEMQGHLASWLASTDDTSRREFVAAKYPNVQYTTI
jgi:arylsulfatase A-like enzyme